MKSTTLTIGITIVLIALAFVFLKSNKNLDEYNRHMCEDVYGLNSQCQEK